MRQLKTMMLLAARWMVVLAACLVVSLGEVFAAAPKKAQNTCDASCQKRCPCCVSKSTPASSSQPLAPPSTTQTDFAKDLQFSPLLTALLASGSEEFASEPAKFSVPYFPAHLSLCVRHCTFLL